MISRARTRGRPKLRGNPETPPGGIEFSRAAADDPSGYGVYLKSEKVLKETHVQLVETKTRGGHNKMYASQELDCGVASPAGVLEVYAPLALSGKHAYKVTGSQYHVEGRALGFDSGGQAHWNRDPDSQLRERKVDTPHFHRFRADGYMEAYQTGDLHDEARLSAYTNDLQATFAIFCREFGIVGLDGITPAIGPQALLPITDDPLDGISFD